MPTISLLTQIAEVQRELTIRRRMYPVWVRRDQMSATAMARQIARMEAVLETLEGCLEPLDETLSLFPEA